MYNIETVETQQEQEGNLPTMAGEGGSDITKHFTEDVQADVTGN